MATLRGDQVARIQRRLRLAKPMGQRHLTGPATGLADPTRPSPEAGGRYGAIAWPGSQSRWWSYGQALTGPGNDSLAIRSTEWFKALGNLLQNRAGPIPGTGQPILQGSRS